MAIDPTTTTTVKVSELASASYNTTDLIPHEVGGLLKKGNLQDLATFIGSIIDVDGGVGFRAVTVTDGQTLPATTEQEFILVGPGTFPNVGGGSTITTTEPLNALVSNGTYWFIGVEIPISASGTWGSIDGNIESQTDLQNVLDLKADLVDGKVPASQLPSYVDDVVEVANYAALPNPGETGKIYITIDTNKVYRWSGSAYIEIAENNAVWGLIEGTLSSQTDLNTALGLKVPYTGATGNVDLGTHKLTASDLVVNHASGSGAAATISKGGNGEALTVLKTSGSGNAASILGGVTLLDELHLNTDLADAYIASAATWNAKQSALTFSSPLVNTSGTISIPAASGSVNGYLSSTDWTTFNTKQTALNGTGFVKISGTTISYDNTTYLSGTVAIANGGTGATTAGAARTNLGATTVGANIFTIPNPNPVTKAYIRANADNTVEWLDGNAFRESIGAGTGNGTVTSVNGTGSYGGLTLTGTVTGSGDLTLGGTPEGTWPISVSGNAASVNTVQVSTNADFYLTFADANNGSPTAEFLYTVGTLKYNPSTGALTAGSFVKSGGTSSQFLMADGSVSTGAGGTVTGTGTSGQIAFWNGTSSITGESNLFWDSTNDRLGIGTASPTRKLEVASDGLNWISGTFSGTGSTNKVVIGNLTTPTIGGHNSALNAWTDFTIAGDNIIFAPFGSESMRVNSSGNVGIGTISPVNNLHVQNGTTANTTLMIQSWGTEASGEFAGIRFKSAANSGNEYGKGFIGYRNNGTGYGRGDLYFCTNNLTDTSNASTSDVRMTITSGGNVGIGTTSPNSILTIGSTDATAVLTAGGGNTHLTLKAMGSQGELIFGAGGVSNGVAGTERMRITSGGNVLIGTTTDAGAKLQVNGSAKTKNIQIAGASGGYTTGDNPMIGFGAAPVSNEFGTIEAPFGNRMVFNQYHGFEFKTSNSGSSTVTMFTIGINGASTFASTVTATGFFNSSDNRLKDLTDYDYNVSDIKPITYLWKDGRDNKKHVGYSAQEVQKVMPDAVNEDEKGFLSVNYVEVLVAKISQMEKEIAYLKSKI